MYTIVSTSPPEPIQDPTPLDNMDKFRTVLESTQGNQLKNIQDQNITNNNDNNDLVICYKLKTIDNALSDT